jgi:hypothetical protein
VLLLLATFRMTRKATSLPSDPTKAGPVYLQPISSSLSKAPKAPLQKLAAVVLAVFFSCVFTSYCLADPILSSQQQSAEDWESIAKIRLQIAMERDFQGEKAFNESGANSFETVGDWLEFYGDEKFLAYSNYQMASQNWERAARTYQSAGDSIKAKKARENVSKSLEAAKRALAEGADLHMKAKDQYQAANNLGKKILALEKAVRNRERLMEMK